VFVTSASPTAMAGLTVGALLVTMDFMSLPAAPASNDSEFEGVEDPDVSAIVTEDDEPLDSWRSEKQQRLLTEPLYASWSGPPPTEGGAPRSFIASANVGIFFDVRRPPIVPDMFLS